MTRFLNIVVHTYTVPQPTVTISRNPDSSTQLFTTNALLLTCTISLNAAAVDTSRQLHAQWSGNPSLSDSSRVAIIRHASYLQASFSSLKSSDAGTYVCSAQILSYSNAVMSSNRAISTIFISICKSSIQQVVHSNIMFNLPTQLSMWLLTLPTTHQVTSPMPLPHTIDLLALST